MRVPFFSAFLIVLAASIALSAGPLHRPDITKEAEIVSVRGEGWIRFVKERDWNLAFFDQALTTGDFVKTGAYGKLDILFTDGTQIKVHNRTTLTIKESGKAAAKKRGTVLGLEVGEVWSRAKAVPEGLRIETPSATAAIRGTDWDMVVDEKGTSYLTVLKGTVEFFNDFGRADVGAGDQAMAEIGKPPVKTFLIRPRERVQWTVSYPMEISRLIPFYSHRREEVLRLLPVARGKAQAAPADLEARVLLAGLLFDAGEREEGLKTFDDVLASQPENCRALTFKGLILLDKGETEKASAPLEQALMHCREGGRTEALFGSAGVYLARNEIEKAAILLEEAARTDTSPVVGVVMANFRAFQGEFTKAVDICSGYAARYPDDDRFPAMAADFSLSLDEGPRAKEFIDTALRANPSSSSAYAILGRYHYLEGRAKEAEHSYRKAVELDPKNTAARSEMGRLLMEKGRYEDSIEEQSRAVEADPRESRFWARRGTLMNWIDDIKRARKDYEQATELNPVDYQSLDGLGFLALKEGRTEEAIQYFLRASVLEPRFAEPHVFLAIAYYQREEFDRALQELNLAGQLDPRDPVPHIIAYLIYQDTYRNFEAVREATRALELMPNLKSVNPVETTQKGLSNLGSALLGLVMTEWASSYAEESFNTFDAASYFFISEKYAGNPILFVSANAQGFLLDPLAIKYSPRYQDIVKRPQHNLTVNTTLGYEDSGFLRQHEIIQQGYVRMPWEMTYLVDFQNHENNGYVRNGDSRGNFLTFAFGGRPDYKNGFVVWGGWKTDNYGDPGTATRPDLDDRFKTSTFTISSGYNYRLGNKNNLLLNFSFNRLKQKFSNADPLGSTGLSGVELSFINRFGADGARTFFEKGLFDAGIVEGVPFFVTDSTGILQLLGEKPIPFTLKSGTDTNTLRSQNATTEDTGFQLRHLIGIGDNHEFSYGAEYVPHLRFKIDEVSSIRDTGNFAGFVDEVLLDGPLYVVPEMEFGDSASQFRFKSESWSLYAFDRWRITDKLLAEMGLFYEGIKTTSDGSGGTDYSRLHPRLGLELRLSPRHILLAAYQKSLYQGTSLSLAPVSTAGLIFNYSGLELVPGTVIEDYRTALESRWTERLFTVVSAEKRWWKNRDTGSENRTLFLSGAVNTFLTDMIGMSVRYRYADSRNTEGFFKDKEISLLPKHILGIGVVCVLPSYIKAGISTLYVAGQYGDDENTRKLPNYWVTDLSATWEPARYRKHWMFTLAFKNIFNASYEIKQDVPAAGRSIFLTAEYRF